MEQEIIEALESTAMTPTAPYVGAKANASLTSIRQHRDQIVRFLNELDSDLTVAEIVEVLEDY